MIDIFYGMCGTLKYTTMTTGKQYRFREQLYSNIKPFCDLNKTIFNNLVEFNDLTFALCRLMRLEELKLKSDSLCIERGITDYFHCYLSRDSSRTISESVIKDAVNLELQNLENLEIGRIKKNLLIMKDSEFVKTKVLNEPHRLATYPTIEDYFRLQEDYVEFTKKYNKIDEVIEITDAHQYINEL